MYNYGGNYGTGCYNNGYAMPIYPTNTNNYAIILVLFILLVIVIGSRMGH